jgi:uncharacterized membrane protein YgcG
VTPRRLRLAALAGLLLAAFAVLSPSPASADEGWTIRSFDVIYDIDSDGIVHVTEDIRVDFGTLQKHGIFRTMPVEYDYDDDNNRVISVGNVEVDNGEEPWQFALSRTGGDLEIKIGDPDVEVSGAQRYRISYVLTAALNPFGDHDEFFWNVTGLDWPVPIESASAGVTVPGGITMADCYQGPEGSFERCEAESSPSAATFRATRVLGSGENLTLVVGLEKGAVAVSPPVLEPKPDPFQEFEDAFDITWLTVGGALAVLVIGAGVVLRQWWVQGRDRWYGEVWYHSDGANVLGRRKPLMARETVLTEFEPPPAGGRDGRSLRPAEVGVLMDESADTLDVTATIVDLAVRKYIRIKETKSGGFLGLFKSTDYEIERLDAPEEELLPYERQTLGALFKGEGSTLVKLSSLKNKFYKDLEKIKEALYSQIATKDGLFRRSPEKSRSIYRIAGFVVGGLGVLGVFLLWSQGWTLPAIALIVVGVVLLLAAPAMPSRTARGRATYLRALGFRKFMVTAETERQRFAERANIFHEYLPYAIVYGCVGKWAKAFEGLGAVEQTDWYIGTRPFVAASFADSLGSFSSSLSSSIASTPGGRGGSGFGGGGGGSGGGGGGGGGGSW